MKRKIQFVTAFIVVALLLIIVVGGRQIVENNENGMFHIKRAWITGNTRVIEEPGMYGQWFGNIFVYKDVATIAFGKEVGEGSADIDAIDVMFNDGSMATNSGLVRLKLPEKGDPRRKKLLEDFAGGYDHFVTAGVVPVIRNAVRLGANLRSAQDAYTTLALYQQAVKDQLQNGIYVSYAAIDTVVNATGDVETKQITKISLDNNGKALREPNSLQLLGCTVIECVIDIPVFDDKVIEMINKRKEEAMLTELSKQTALRAKQAAITAEEEGLAAVAVEKYKKEVELVAATTKAREIFEVAKFDAQSALQEKAAKISRAQGVKEELALADGLSAREQYQIDANVKRDIGVAQALKDWVGPQNVMYGGTGASGGTGGLENVLMIKMLDDMVTKTRSK